MANQYIDRAFYEAIIHFEESDEAQDYYYKVMGTETETNTGREHKMGRKETIREQILRAYTMLFCEDMDLKDGAFAGPDEVDATADRLYIGSAGFDPQHWYRMQHHFPVIDEDNYDRFAALVIADLNAGPLREAVLNGGEMLLLGEPDPLHMTEEQRLRQQMRRIQYGSRGLRQPTV